MDLRQTFQSIISLHQSEMPFDLVKRSQEIPVDCNRIVTVTGVRRCGKSSLLKLAINQLLANGVPKENIIMVGFDDERFLSMDSTGFDEMLQAYREMFPFKNLKDTYMFFDEIQLVKGWELFVLRVYKNYCQHVFITGSTSEMLSGQMASALRGWPIELMEYPLSFSEYKRFKNVNANMYTEEGVATMKYWFNEYCTDGGFPQNALIQSRYEKVANLQGYFNTMLFRDMIEHYGISTSIAVVKYFLKRVMENLTKPTSVNAIFNDLKSQGYKVSKDSLYQWLAYACDIFMFYQVPRYTKSLVKESSSLSKYYLVDHAFRNAILLPQSDDNGKSLENIVFHELKRTLCGEDKIYYFKELSECDFVVQRGSVVTELVQVCWSLTEENESREIRGIIEASKVTGCTNCKIVTYEQTKTFVSGELEISVVPVWSL